MNMKKIAGVFFGSLFAIVLISNILNSAPPTGPDRPAGALTRETAAPAGSWGVLSGTYRVLKESVHGDYRVKYDEASNTVTIDIWLNTLTADLLNSALLNIQSLESWNHITASMKDLEIALQLEYVEHNVYGMTVIVNLINPEDLTQIFATVSRGEILYDIVDATPPGEPIPGTTFDSLVTGSVRSAYSGGNSSAHNIVLNTNTHVFHNTSCPRIKDMTAANAKDFYGSNQDAIDFGYTPCQICGG